MAYSLVQPLFWKPASNANEVQYEYFTGLIKEKSTLGYVFKRGKSIEGFIIGEIYPANPLYKKVHLCKVDDYTVRDEQWETVGKQLLMALQYDALAKGADYLYIVSGYHHIAKMKLLSELGLKKVSDTWTGAI